tara:strand:- start:3908 stop:4147 length:240 start_codon:yes stop_codon:yes gene_type:complete
MSDPVNKPQHYLHGKLEVVQAIIGLGVGYLEGNVIKYLARWKFKGDTNELKLQDLLKARHYLDILISTYDEFLDDPSNP